MWAIHPGPTFRSETAAARALAIAESSAITEDARARIAAVKARLRSEEDIYETMLRDTYQNGIVLARRKYRYLAYAYRLFVVGLTLTETRPVPEDLLPKGFPPPCQDW